MLYWAWQPKKLSHALSNNNTLLRNSILTGALRPDSSFFVNEITENFLKTLFSDPDYGIRRTFNIFWSEMMAVFVHWTLEKTQFGLMIDIDDSLCTFFI